jgi:long-chain acyl-CoA synthetase
VESILIVSPYVENIMVHADPFHSYAVAILVVSQSALEHWAQTNGVQYDDFGKLCRSKEANKEVLLSLQKVKSYIVKC